VSTATSTAKKTLNKSAPEFQVDPTFRVETPFPGVPRGSAFKSTDTPRTYATKLSNGLTVASQDTYGLMSSFAFLVNRGSAYEVQQGPDAEVGATHVLELLAFRSTANRSHQDLLMEIEQLGGMVQCVGSRDGLLYCVDVLRENTEAALDILADTILHAQYTPEEVDDCREIVRLQQNEMPADMLSRDAAQMAGYRGSPMGNSHVCPESHIAAMDSSVLRRFKAKHFHGANCFVSGAGIEHDRFVGLIQEKFKALPSAPPPSLVGVGGGALPPSRFVGGMVANERQLREPFIKLAIGFEVCGWKDPMLVPMCVLQQLLGGGSSFSAGGPGKGMYTRLYREMLNQHYWVESAEAFVTIHEDTGMLGIDGACTPEYASAMIKVGSSRHAST
jgi:processing peptidase subunit alpha